MGAVGEAPGLEGIGTGRVEVAGVHRPGDGGASVEVMPKGEVGAGGRGWGVEEKRLGWGWGRGESGLRG